MLAIEKILTKRAPQSKNSGNRAESSHDRMNTYKPWKCPLSRKNVTMFFNDDKTLGFK
jgi:hypothetical protein